MKNKNDKLPESVSVAREKMDKDIKRRITIVYGRKL